MAATAAASESPLLVRRPKFFKPTWRGNYVPDSNKKPEEEEEVLVDASSFQTKKDVVIGAKTVTELRAELEQIVGKPKDTTPTEPIAEEHLVIVEKEEKKSLVKWLDMLCDALNQLLVTAPPIAESYVVALSHEVNERLDNISELEQLLEAGVEVSSGDEIYLQLVQQLDWLEEQKKLWKTLGEDTAATTENSQFTYQVPAAIMEADIPLETDTLREQKQIVELTMDALKSTVRNSLRNSPFAEQLLSGLIRSILDNKVDSFWKRLTKSLSKKKADKYTIERIKELPFFVKEQTEELTSICRGIKDKVPSALCVAVRKQLEDEQSWLDARFAAMTIGSR